MESATKRDPTRAADGRLYAGLSLAEREAAAAIGVIQDYAKDQPVFQEGDNGDCMYTVLAGRVEISKSIGSGRQQLLTTVGTGDFFGEMTMVDAQPRSAHAIAREPSRLRVLRRPDLDHLLEINPRIILNLFNVTNDRLRAMNAQFIEQILHQEKMALVGQVANSIIHDFKSPMTVIRAAAELMSLKVQDEFAKARCEVIVRNVDRITGMANDLLAFSLGTVRLNCHWVEPQRWIDNVGELLSPMLERRNIIARREVLTKEPVWMDPEKMMRVIYNLSANAIEAMPTGGVLTVRMDRQGEEFKIDVSDTGHGIDEAVRSRLFQAFVTHGKKNGTGLGTAIVKKIVEEHGGSISFTTETGLGTTFHIRLPIPALHQPEVPTVAEVEGKGELVRG
jgi:signal transduction histidine kinase